MLRPCHAAKGLEYVFPIWYTRCGHVWFTLAMRMQCSSHAILLKATAQHIRRETACGLPAHVRLLPATTWSSTKVVIRSIPISDAGGHCENKQRLSWTSKRVVAAHYKKGDLLNCWTSSSDISSYHASFHEGHSTIGAWQGRGMACVNWRYSTACYVWIGLNSLGLCLPDARFKSEPVGWLQRLVLHDCFDPNQGCTYPGWHAHRRERGGFIITLPVNLHFWFLGAADVNLCIWLLVQYWLLAVECFFMDWLCFNVWSDFFVHLSVRLNDIFLLILSSCFMLSQ